MPRRSRCRSAALGLAGLGALLCAPASGTWATEGVSSPFALYLGPAYESPRDHDLAEENSAAFSVQTSSLLPAPSDFSLSASSSAPTELYLGPFYDNPAARSLVSGQGAGFELNLGPAGYRGTGLGAGEALSLPFELDVPGACGSAASVVEFLPGDGTQHAQGADDFRILGPSDGEALVLGTGGVVELELEWVFADGPGKDLWVYEQGEAADGYSVEGRFTQGEPFVPLGSSPGGSLGIDLQGTGLPGVKWLRIVDDGVGSEPIPENAGADIDAVVGDVCRDGPVWIGGLVTDPSATPLEGIHVELTPTEEYEAAVSVTTSSAGTYEFGPLLGGDYLLETDGPGFFHPTTLTPLFVDAAPGSNPQATLELPPFRIQEPVAGQLLTVGDEIRWDTALSADYLLTLDPGDGRPRITRSLPTAGSWILELVLANGDQASLWLEASVAGNPVGVTEPVAFLLAMPTTALLDEHRRVFFWDHIPGAERYRITFEPDNNSDCSQQPAQPLSFSFDRQVDPAGRAWFRIPGPESPDAWTAWCSMMPAEYGVVVEVLAGIQGGELPLGRVTRGRLHCPGGECSSLFPIYNPVILVHGWKEDYGKCWLDLEEEGDRESPTVPNLVGEGFSVYGLSYPPTGFAETGGALLRRALDHLRPHLGSGQEWQILAHSFGGLVSRSYLQGRAAMWKEGQGPCDEDAFEPLGYREDVRGLVTLGTPHEGVIDALLLNFAGLGFGIGCNEPSYTLAQLGVDPLPFLQCGIDPPLIVSRLADLEASPWPEAVEAYFIAAGTDFGDPSWNLTRGAVDGVYTLLHGEESDGAVLVSSALARHTGLTAYRWLACGEQHTSIKHLFVGEPAWEAVRNFLTGTGTIPLTYATQDQDCNQWALFRTDFWIPPLGSPAGNSPMMAAQADAAEPTMGGPLWGTVVRARRPMPGDPDRYLEKVIVSNRAGAARMRIPREGAELEVLSEGFTSVTLQLPPPPVGHTQTLEVVLQELPDDGRPRRPSIEIDPDPYWLRGDSTTTVYPSCENAADMRLTWGLLEEPVWEPYATTREILAPTSAGPHALFAQYRSAAGDTSVWVSDALRVPGDSTGTLRIFSNVPEGQVLLNGSVLDVSFPATFEKLDPGTQLFDVLAPGYESRGDVEATIEVDRTTITYVPLVEAAPPPAFVLEAPEQEGGVRSDEALLSWQPSVDPAGASWTTYTVRTYTDSLAVEPLGSHLVGGLTQTEPAFSLADSTVHYWDVLARNSAGLTTASSGGIRWFFVDDTAPTFSLSGPDSGRIFTHGEEDTLVVLAQDWARRLTVVALLSTDDGLSFPDTIAVGEPGPIGWTVPTVSADSCRIRVRVSDPAGNGGLALSERFVIGASTAVDDGLPARLALLRNHPNPFNPATVIPFELPRSGKVRIAIYDARGRLVDVVENGPRRGGRHTVTWHGTDRRGRSVASGIYHLRLEFEGEVRTRKLALVR